MPLLRRAWQGDRERACVRGGDREPRADFATDVHRTGTTALRRWPRMCSRPSRCGSPCRRPQGACLRALRICLAADGLPVTQRKVGTGPARASCARRRALRGVDDGSSRPARTGRCRRRPRAERRELPALMVIDARLRAAARCTRRRRVGRAGVLHGGAARLPHYTRPESWAAGPCAGAARRQPRGDRPVALKQAPGRTGCGGPTSGAAAN